MEALNIPPGVLDKKVEFFAHKGDVWCFYDGMTLPYKKFPSWMIDSVKVHILANPDIFKDVTKQPLNFGGDFIKKYIYYAFGRLNMVPDIDLNGTINHEFDIRFNNGKPLSPCEIEVLKRVSMADKNIADQRSNSRETITSHWQNMRRKSGLNNKVELAIMAVKEGII